jgi:predicted negative regulator of RcsB-dependent stress response
MKDFWESAGMALIFFAILAGIALVIWALK